MLQFVVTLQCFVMDRVQSSKDRGATLVEYGLIVGLIIAIVIAAMGILGTNVNILFNKIGTKVGGVTL